MMRPKLGFLGVGWIGRTRMEALRESGKATIAAIADPSERTRRAAQAIAPEAESVPSLEQLLDLDLDGVVIATPSAMHASQSIAALEQGLAVFCQKPLGRTEEEVAGVIESARGQDRLLGLDLSYRHTTAMQRVREVVRSGEIGDVYAADLAFHNAYGPDKPWFFERALSGGGCVIDLGLHLIDALAWILGSPGIEEVSSRLHHRGALLAPGEGSVEDHATIRLDLDGGAVAQIACSWCLPAGQDAVIRCELYGTRGGVAFRNVNGSFYDFVAERYEGTKRITLAEPPDAWGGRALIAWAEKLAKSSRFSPEDLEGVAETASIIDAVYRGHLTPERRSRSLRTATA